MEVHTVNKENFTHKCNRCKHNFATCKSKRCLFLSDLPNEINEAFPELEADTVLWCDMYEEVDLDNEKFILEKAGDHFDITTDGLVSRMLSIEDALHFIERYNLREAFPGTYILPSQE